MGSLSDSQANGDCQQPPPAEAEAEDAGAQAEEVDTGEKMEGVASIALLPSGAISGHFIRLPDSVCYGLQGTHMELNPQDDKEMETDFQTAHVGDNGELLSNDHREAEGTADVGVGVKNRLSMRSITSSLENVLAPNTPCSVAPEPRKITAPRGKAAEALQASIQSA